MLVFFLFVCLGEGEICYFKAKRFLAGYMSAYCIIQLDKQQVKTHHGNITVVVGGGVVIVVIVVVVVVWLVASRYAQAPCHGCYLTYHR